MKRFVFFAAMAVWLSAFAQAPAQPKPEPIKAEPIKAEPAKAEAAKPKATKAAAKHSNRRQEDARQCLERPTNTEIIKCAEEYL